MRVPPALLALLAGAGLATPALAQGTAAPAQPSSAPIVSAVPAGGAAPAVPGVVGTLAQPAPGTGGGGALPVGRDGPVTAGMVFGGPQPATGHNSFTRNQAAHRIAQAGFSGVTGLRKDAHGVWRGTAQRGNAPASVWLDYQGKVGAS